MRRMRRLCEEFKRTLKDFVARCGTPNTIVSDNALTFKATNQWLDVLSQNEDLFNYLNTQRIKWRFNLARAPWWGGFYERMVSIMKASLSKVVGRALLKYDELEEVLLDIECFMNNRNRTPNSHTQSVDTRNVGVFSRRRFG